MIKKLWKQIKDFYDTYKIIIWFAGLMSGSWGTFLMNSGKDLVHLPGTVKALKQGRASDSIGRQRDSLKTAQYILVIDTLRGMALRHDQWIEAQRKKVRTRNVVSLPNK